MERNLRGLLNEAQVTDPVGSMLEEAIELTLAQSELQGPDKERLGEEFALFREELGDFQFALSRPTWTLPEKDQAGSGGLLSITVNPYACKGCMECIAVCDDDALRSVVQTDESVKSHCSRRLFTEASVCVTLRSASSSQTSTHSMQPLQAHGFTVIERRPPEPASCFSGSV